MDAAISTAELMQALSSAQPPIVIDVRRAPAFRAAGTLIDGALRRTPESVQQWAPTLPRSSNVVVYCVHGHEVSQNARTALAAQNIPARYLDGGIEAWRSNGGALRAKPVDASSRWVTRERPKIDRIACPWLIARFIDPEAEFLYVPTPQVREIAAERQATAYDVPEVEFTHVGERCSFDAFILKFRLQDPALDALATIVRGADTGELDLAPQAAGLAAVSLGLSRLFADDHEMLRHGMTLYDALYLWCRDGPDEAHSWNPQAIR